MTISSYLEGLVKVLGIGAAFAAIPLFAAFAKLEPPWPPAIGYVTSALVLVAALISWEWTRKSQVGHRRRWIVAGVALLLIGLFSYFFLYSNYIDPIPGTAERVTRGYECTSAAKLVYKDACPNLPTDALEGAEWEPTELWTRQSVTNIRLALTASWLAFAAGLIIVAGSVVAGRKV